MTNGLQSPRIKALLAAWRDVGSTDELLREAVWGTQDGYKQAAFGKEPVHTENH